MKKIVLFFLILISVVSGWAQKADPTKYAASGATTSTTERINFFNLKEVSFTNTTCTTYSNQTTKAIGMAPGESITGSFQLGTCGGTMVSSAAKIFIDWNGDFDFADAGETVYTSTSAVTVATTFNFSFTVPTSATIGLTTMMRVVNQYNTTPANIQPTGTFLRGETQDYTIQITLFTESIISVFNGLNVNAMKAGDFDNDGDLDLLVKETTTPSVRLYRNNTTTAGTLVLANTGYSFPSNILIDGWLDFNNDGYLDIMTHLSGGAASVYLSNKGLSFTATALSFGTSISSIDWADYDKDGDLDFLIRNSGASSPATIFKQLPDNSYINAGNVSKGIYFVDYDSDGDYDVIEKTEMYTNVNSNYELTHTFPTYGAHGTSRPIHHDFDSDGDIDMVYIYFDFEGGVGGNFQYFNNINNVFTPVNLLVDYFPNFLADPFDFDNNGKIEIITASSYPTAPVYYSIYEVNSSGNPVLKYKVPRASATADMETYAIETGDFDKDGKVDFITSSYNYASGTGAVRFFLNRSTATNQAPSVPANLTAVVGTEQVKLKWDKSTDDRTAQSSIYYNLEIRKGSDTLKIPLSTKKNTRKVYTEGNVSLSNEYALDSRDLTQGIYSWSVQAIDQSQKPSAFAAEGTFEVTNGNFALTKITNGSLIKSVYNTTIKEYAVAYIQSGDLFVQRLDERGQKIEQPIKQNLISTGCTDIDVAIGVNGTEYLIGWLASNGAYVKRFTPATANATNEVLISNQAAYGYRNISLAYNSVAKNYAGFFSSTSNIDPYPSTIRGLILTPSGTTAITKGTLTTLNTVSSTSFPYRYHDQISVKFSEAYQTFVAGWLDVFTLDFAYEQMFGAARFQLLSTSLVPLATPLSVTFDSGEKLSITKSQFSENYLAAWQETDQYPKTGTGSNTYDYNYETRGAYLKLSGSIATPQLTIELIAPNLSKASSQGTAFTGSSDPSIALNSKRNEYTMVWKNDASGYLKLQRYDIKESKLLLKDELRINDIKGSVPNVTFNPDRNELLLAYVDGGNVFYTQFKIPKDDLPLVSSVDKPKAYAGDKVVITGDFFGKNYQLNSVNFGTISSTITSTYSDGKHLEVIVPQGLGRTPVPISVSFDDQTGVSSFTFENLTLHSITSTDVTQGEVGTVVTITGSKFTEDKSQLIIKFGNVAVDQTEIISNTTSEIKVKVPVGAVRGTSPLSVTIQGQVVNAPNPFRVIIPPAITSVDAPDGFVSCKTVTIKGTNFTDDISKLNIKFGTLELKPADIVTATVSALIVKVPIGAEGNIAISVTTDDRTATSSLNTVNLGSKVVSFKEPGKIELTNRTTDAVDMQLKILNECSVKEVKLWQKGISEQTTAWKNTVLNGLEDNRIDLKLNENQFENDPIGLSLFYQIDDLSGKAVYSDTFNIYKQYIEFDSTNFVPNLVFGGSGENYNIVSIPYQMNPNKITSVFKDVFNAYGYDSAKWRIFHYANNGTTKKYVEYLNGLNEIELGKSYWIIIRNSQEIFFEGAQSADLSNGPFTITLQPGWNQIGNPYNFNISWADIMTFNGNPTTIESIKTFKNGAFQQAATINKFSGGFVRNNSQSPVSLKIPFIMNKSINGRSGVEFSTNIEDEKWRVPIELKNAGFSNSLSKIGMHPESEENVDFNDEHVMPHFQYYLDVKFRDGLAASIVKSGDSFTWDFEVSTNVTDKNLALSWNKDELGEGEKQLYLHDLDQERIVNMKSESAYSFTYGLSKNFRIYYGDKDYILQHAYPERNVMGRAYPIPFDSNLIIPFTVSEDQTQVRISVYNLMGQEVSLITNEQKDKGFYEQSWKGLDQVGQPVPAGTYIIRLQTSGREAFTQTQKVIKINLVEPNLIR